MDQPACIQKDVLLNSFSSWKTGGVAEYLAMPESLEDYKACIQWASAQSLEITFLGQGSNSLISDLGIPGLVLCSKKFQKIEIVSHEDDPVFQVSCESGVLKNKLMRAFLKQKLSPALFLSGIPGDVGGGVVMNAGVSDRFQPKEFCEIVKSFKVLKWSGSKGNLVFSEQEFLNKDIQWSYRSSRNWQPGFISEILFEYSNQPDESIPQEVKTAIANRRLKQPYDKPSCGSVFVNPPGHHSGALIEGAGLKGFQIGDAQVSYKHANFIVNRGRATSQDIHQTIEHVKQKVFEKYNIQLHTEVVYLGPWEHLEFT